MARQKIKPWPRKKDNSGKISLIIVIIILLAGITFTIITINTNKIGVIEKPEVSIPVNTEENDKQEIFTAKMSFEGNTESLDDISYAEYKKAVADAFAEIGYEKLKSDESTEYIKDAVKKQLISVIKTKEPNNKESEDFIIKSVYIDKFISSKYQNTNNKGKANSEDVANMFKTK